MTAATTMPEAAVDEDDAPATNEDQIGTTRKPTPLAGAVTVGGYIAKSLSPKCRGQTSFQARAPSIRLHGAAALVGREAISAHGVLEFNSRRRLDAAKPRG